MALLLKYTDDVWDTTTYPKRLFIQGQQTMGGVTYLTFDDRTPYSQEGTPVTGGMLSAIVQAINGFTSSHTVFSEDGLTITQTNDIGTLQTSFSADGLTITKRLTDGDGNAVQLVTTFDASGLIVDSVATIE